MRSSATIALYFEEEMCVAATSLHPLPWRRATSFLAGRSSTTIGNERSRCLPQEALFQPSFLGVWGMLVSVRPCCNSVVMCGVDIRKDLCGNIVASLWWYLHVLIQGLLGVCRR